jgi:hypothetical protein
MNARTTSLVIVVSVVSAASAAAAELQVTKVVFPNSKTDAAAFDMSIDLHAPGQSISGLQCDLVYNPALLAVRSVQATDAVAAQTKQLSTAEPEKGVLRIVIIGMNAFPILNGRLVTVTFVAAASDTGGAPVRLSNMKAATPEGTEVRLVWSEPSSLSVSGASSAGRRTRRR